MKKPLRDKQFALFEREVRRLQNKWGVNDWNIFVAHAATENRHADADFKGSSTKRAAMIRLNPKRLGVQDGDVRGFARHEMCHALLAEFSCLASSRHVTEDELEAAEEALVQRLIRLLPK